MKLTNFKMIALTCLNTALALHTLPPFGLFEPYDLNIALKKPAPHCFQVSIMGEKSYHVRGWATDYKDEDSFKVGVMQIYEPYQNIVSMYQGFDATGGTIQTLTTPFTQLLDSIAGGPGGGVSNLQNGIFVPSAKFCCGQIALSTTYSFGHGLYLDVSLPIRFARLHHVNWCYGGNNILFAGEKIQDELINAFAQDAQQYFNLNINGWKQTGVGDLTLIAQWQRDFPQRRALLKNVQTTIRAGLSFPTGKKTNEHLILSMPFGADGSVGLPFGGGITLNLGNHGEIGFNGQFWYFWSNEKLRRIKTFPTQTSLLLPVITKAYKEYSFTQNFNLHGSLYSSCKRFTLKSVYQYWRKQKDRITPIGIGFNSEVVNTDERIEEATAHQVIVIGSYSPRQNEFKRVIPQFELFWKGSFKGTRMPLASTFGAQFSIIF